MSRSTSPLSPLPLSLGALLVLAFLSSTSAAPSPAAAPNPLPAPSPALLPAGIHFPLHQRRSKLLRRSDPDAIRSWALREKGLLNGKYGPAGSGLRRRQEQETTSSASSTRTTQFSVARLPSTSSRPAGTATATGTAGGNATATQTVGKVDVMNFEADLAYYAQVGVGVPPQYMNTILDTGSADLWITSSACSVASGCNSIPLLNVSESLTSVDMNTSFSVRYGSGSASGDIHQDYVSFGGYNVSSQAYALVDTVSQDLLSGNISGLMGLGWQQLAASGVTPFWQNLFQAGVLPFPGFAFALSRFVNVTSATQNEPGGSLTLGYLNASLYQGEINYVDIPSGMQSYWVVPMTGVSLYRTVNSTIISTNTSTTSSSLSTGASSTSSALPSATSGATALNQTLIRTNITTASAMVAIDTGTTLIGGPKDVIETLYSGIEGALAATGDYAGYYSYPCETNVNVSLTFGGVAYNMTSDDFNLGPFGTTANNVSTCLGAFFDLTLSSNSRITWVIGAAFLKNVYSVYRADPPSVGFALLASGNSSAATNSTTSNSTFTTRSGVPQIPTGIYGPSGVTSLRGSSMGGEPTAQEITTAIQAGQTVSRTSGAMRAMLVGREGKLAGLVGLFGVGLLAL